jgi:hypothetical protein
LYKAQQAKLERELEQINSKLLGKRMLYWVGRWIGFELRFIEKNDRKANSVQYKSIFHSGSSEKKDSGFELEQAYSFQKRNDEPMNPYGNHSIHGNNQIKYTSLSEIKAK